MFPVSIAFWWKINAKKYYFLWQKRKAMNKASHKNRAVELKVRPTRAVKHVFSQSFLNPIWTGGGGAESAPLRFFLHNSKTPGDIEMKLFDFNFTPLMDILRILSITIVVRCCHSNLLFPVCHVNFWVEKTKKLELFSR